MYIEKIEVGEKINGNFRNIFNFDYKVETIKNSFEYEVSETKFNSFNLNATSQKFETQEQEMVFKFNSKNYETNLMFLQKQELIFKIIKNNGEVFYFYGTFKNKEIDFYYNTGFVSVKFIILQNTPFIKINNFNFEIDNQEEIIGTSFPIEFGYEFTGVGNTYENSVFTVNSNSQFVSQALFSIESSGNPKIKLENENISNLNAYVSTNFLLPLNNDIILSSFFPTKGIYLYNDKTGNYSNIEQEREFKYKTFLEFKEGQTNIYCNNISKLGVQIYELYPTF